MLFVYSYILYVCMSIYAFVHLFYKGGCSSFGEGSRFSEAAPESSTSASQSFSMSPCRASTLETVRATANILGVIGFLQRESQGSFKGIEVDTRQA